ncbi:MAG: endonuclease domain-containing protein [Lysobacteraceae bacterium]
MPTDTLAQSRRLRREMTDAERALWYHLRAGRLEGIKFRRQHPLPPFIADFCCIDAHLIVEVDGSQHSPDSDAARRHALERRGWRIARFWNHDVLQHTEAVVDEIRRLVADPTLSPTPLPAGEGHEASEIP